MTKTLTTDKNEDVEVEIEENKEDIIESVAEETGLNNPKDRQIVEDTVDNLIIDQEFENTDLDEYEYFETSIVEDVVDFIKGGKVITEGKITDISKSSGYHSKLIVTIEVSETGDTFTQSFNYNDNSMSEDLKSFFALIGVESGKPSDLIDKNVPINNIHKGDDNYNYEIHWPPKSELLSKISHKVNRISRKYKFISLTENDSYDFKYKPTLRLYALLTLVLTVSLSTQIIILGFIGFAISLACFFLVAIYHIIVLMETYDFA